MCAGLLGSHDTFLVDTLQSANLGAAVHTTPVALVVANVVK